MGLLQDPLRSLDQVTWYLDQQEQETLPGAFELAAGNLCRQVLEQVFFVLCQFSGMPRQRYARADNTLQTAGKMLTGLGKVDPSSGRTFLEQARRRGPRIRKFARYPRTLKKWQRLLNEPSHFQARFRNVSDAALRTFVAISRDWFDELDQYLVVAAVNEFMSGGKVKATLSNDPMNTPGISQTSVVSAANLLLDEDGRLILAGPKRGFLVVSDTALTRGRWPGVPVMVRGTVGMVIGEQLVTKDGNPVDLRTMETVLMSFARTEGQRRYLTGVLRKLGLEVEWKSIQAE